MADKWTMRTPSGGGSFEPVRQPIEIHISGEDKLRSLARMLNNIAHGIDLQKYWKGQEELINDVSRAYANYIYNVSEASSVDLIKSFNALKATGADISSIFSNHEDITSAYRNASKSYGMIASSFSEANFKDAFDAMEFMKAQGLDLQQVFEQIDNAASVDHLRKTIDELNEEIGRYKRTIEELKSGEANLKADKYDKLVRKQKREFANFVNANDVPKSGYGNTWDVAEVNKYFDAVSSGIMTSKEAIAKFKVELPHLISSSMTSDGGELDGDSIAAFSAKVESILTKLGELREQLTQTSTKVDEVKGLIGSIGSVGGATGANGITGATGNIDSLTAAIERFASAIENIIPVLERFQGIKLDFSLGGNKSPIQKNAEFGIASRQSLSELKERVNALREFLGEIVGASDEFQLLNKITSGTGLKFDIFEILEGINGAGSYDKQLKAFRDYINIVQKAAEIKGIDISSVTSQFGKSADEMIEDTQKVLSGEKDMETALGGLKGIFGGGGGNNPPFDPTPLLESIERLITALNDLRKTADTLGDDMFTRLGDKLKDLDTDSISNLLSTLTHYLPQLSGVDVSKLQALADIDWGNWTNFEVRQESYERFQEMMEKMSGAQVLIFQNGDQQYSSKKLEEDSARYARALSAVNKALISARENARRWTAARDGASSAAYRQLLDSIRDLNELKDNIENYSGSGFRDALDRINADINESVNTMSENNERFNADAMLEGSREYSNALSQISNTIRAIESQTAKYENIFRDVIPPDELEELSGLVQLLRDLRREVESPDGISRNDFGERLADIKNRANELNEVLTRFARGEQDTLTEGSRRYNDALSKLNSMLIQVTENSNKWRDARHGSASAEYEEYTEQGDAIRQLISDIESGTVSVEGFRRRASEIARTMKEDEAAIRAAGGSVRSLGNSFQGALGVLLKYFSVTRIVYAAINKLKEMVKISIEIESAMARIQIVTGATDSQMRHFFEATATQAKALGKNLADVAGSIETFSRLGYSISDASELSKYATIMSNVANVDVDAATTGITSIIKGFDMSASDAEHVSDVLVQVGQKYAISAEELMVAFERGGAALNASGTSFEKSAALFAATNASLQNAATTGTLWKTVSARIRGAKTELEEMGESTDDLVDGFSKYRDEILALSGVDIMIDDNTYKDMYDIFVELASVWDTIDSDTAKSRIAEILGGTRQLSGIASTIQNIADAQNAYNDALSATGVSESANAIYMETTQAHIEQLSASYQELAADFFNSDFLKFFVDLGRGIIDIIDSIVDSIGVFGTVFVGSFVTAIISGIASVVSAVGGLSSAFTLLLSADFAPLIAAFSGLFPFAPVLLGIAAAIGVVYTTTNIYLDKTVRAIDKAVEKAEDSQNAFKEASSELQSAELNLQAIQNRIDEINSLESITIIEEEELRKLELAKSAAEATVKLLREAEGESRKQAAIDANKALTTTGTWNTGGRPIVEGFSASGGSYGIFSDSTGSGTIIDKARDYKKTIVELEEEQARLNEEINNGTIAEEDYADASKRLDEIDKRLETLREEYSGMVTHISSLYSSLFDSDGSILPGFEETAAAVEDFLNYVNSASDKTANLKNAAENIVSGNIEKATKQYENAVEKMKSLGFDPNQTIFGNIDTNNRQVLQWTDDMLAKYSDAIESYGDSIENLRGRFSTVYGMSREYDGVEIAFSPMLQTEDGPVLLDSDTVDEYIWGLIQEAGENWTTEDLLKLDTKGLTVNGRKINGLIADVGKTARATGEAMHYAGELGELGDAMRQIDDANKLAAMSAEDFANAYGSNDTVNDIVNEAIRLGIVTGDSNSELIRLGESLSEVGIIGTVTADDIESTVLSLEELSGEIKDFTEFQDKLSEAMDASKSAIGLNADQITSLKNAYGALEDFDPTKLFETTYDGVHLNEEELKRLNEELENNKLADLYTTLASKLEQYHKIQAEGGDTSQIEAEIYDTELLISQYEGLTSAYNTYLSAKSGKKERDSYEGIGADYEEMKKILDMGWYGDDSLNSYLDLILSKAARTGDAVKDFERLNKTIEGTSHSILDYWRYDEKTDDLASDGLFDFLDDVHKKFGDTYASIEDGKYVFDLTGNKLNEVADAFGMSAEMVQIFERALIDTGSVVVLDNDRIEEITGSLKDLQDAGKIAPELDLNFDLAEMSLEDIQNKIKELNEAKAKINVETDDEGARKLQLLDAAVSALQNKAVNLKINTAIENGKTVQELMDMDDETLSSTLDIEVNGDGELQQARDMLQALSGGTSVPITVKIDESQFSALTNSGSEATIVYHVNRDDVDAFMAESHDDDATVTFGVDRHLVDEFLRANINRPATVTYTADTSKLPTTFTRLKRYIDYVHVGEASGTMKSVKTARANGSMYNAPLNYKRAFANGSVALDEDELALVNELGTESIIRDGIWSLIPGGMHQEHLKKGDIILSAEQTKALINTGKAAGHARAYAMGTLLSNAYDSGSGAARRTSSNKTVSLAKKSSSSKKSTKKSSSKSSKKSSSKSSSSSSGDEFDWIEVLLDRWERAIDSLSATAENIYRKLGDRISATDEEIDAITNKIRLEYAAYDKYIAKANSVNLSAALKEKVRDGSIEITKYNKSTQDLISKYKDWYEKALDAASAIDELHGSLADLYSSRFDTIETHFENRLALVEHKIQAYNNDIDKAVEKGYLESARYNEAIQAAQLHNLETLKDELGELLRAMSEGMNSGEIEHGSEAWFDMEQRINGVKESIQDLEISIAETDNTLRQLKWDNFEYLQNLISNVTEEADFLIELMSSSDLFGENGSITDRGMATLGLHAQNYNVYMNQADRYAEQIKSISEDLANNPYDTKLIEQRQELLKLQRDSILSAEDEKQAIVDLTDDGIKKELEYLNELIDTYKNSIDKAKDLYDYQKRVEDQASNITKLQKQLSAYAGDTSEENRSRVQKLQVELDDAIETLQETQYDHSISAQKELLDDFYNDYEELLNGRLDNVDVLISETLDAVNANASVISDALEEQASEVGYTISDNIMSIWEDGGDASNIVTKYGDTFAAQITNVNATLNDIAAYVAAMVENSDAIADLDVSKVTGYTAKVSTNTEKTSNISSSMGAAIQTKSTTTSTSGIAAGDTVNASGAKIYNYVGGTAFAQQYADDPVYTVTKVSNGWVQVRHHSMSSGVTGWFKAGNVKKYKLGGLVDYTGLAQVDGTPERPESFLNADDTRNLMALIDTLRKIKSGKTSIFGSSSNINGVVGSLSKIAEHRNVSRGTTIGDVSYEITIPIDHVEDYEDFMNRIRSDRQFETMIQDMTIGQVVGRGKLSKNRYSWK